MMVIFVNDETGDFRVENVLFVSKDGVKQGEKIAKGDPKYPKNIDKKQDIDIVTHGNGHGGGPCTRDAFGVLHCPP